MNGINILNSEIVYDSGMWWLGIVTGIVMIIILVFLVSFRDKNYNNKITTLIFIVTLTLSIVGENINKKIKYIENVFVNKHS